MSESSSNPTLPDCATLVNALQRARQTRDFDSPELRQAVSECAAHYRMAGLGPEKLLVTLKQRVRDETLQDVGDWFRAVLTDRVIVWSLESYYGIQKQ